MKVRSIFTKKVKFENETYHSVGITYYNAMIDAVGNINHSSLFRNEGDAEELKDAIEKRMVAGEIDNKEMIKEWIWEQTKKEIALYDFLVKEPEAKRTIIENEKGEGKMKLIIAGSRELDGKEITDLRFIEKAIKDSKIKREEIEEIISGGARGIDKLAEKFAVKNGIKFTEMKADWDKNGKAAGYIRNEEMSKVGDQLLAVWNGESKGTRHMIDIMKAEGKKVSVLAIGLEEEREKQFYGKQTFQAQKWIKDYALYYKKEKGLEEGLIDKEKVEKEYEAAAVMKAWSEEDLIKKIRISGIKRMEIGDLVYNMTDKKLMQVDRLELKEVKNKEEEIEKWLSHKAKQLPLIGDDRLFVEQKDFTKFYVFKTKEDLKEWKETDIMPYHREDKSKYKREVSNKKEFLKHVKEGGHYSEIDSFKKVEIEKGAKYLHITHPNESWKKGFGVLVKFEDKEKYKEFVERKKDFYKDRMTELKPEDPRVKVGTAWGIIISGDREKGTATLVNQVLRNYKKLDPTGNFMVYLSKRDFTRPKILRFDNKSMRDRYIKDVRKLKGKYDIDAKPVSVMNPIVIERTFRGQVEKGGLMSNDESIKDYLYVANEYKRKELSNEEIKMLIQQVRQDEKSYGHLVKNINFKENNLETFDLRGLDLSGSCFRGMNLKGIDLTGIKGKDISFEGSNLSGVNLTSAFLTKANFKDARSEKGAAPIIDKAVMFDTLIDMKNFPGLKIKDAAIKITDDYYVEKGTEKNIRSNSEIKTIIRTARKNKAAEYLLKNTDFRKTNVRELNLKGLDLSGCSFRGMDLSGKDLSGIRGHGIDFSYADLTGVKMENAQLVRPNFYKSTSKLSDPVSFKNTEIFKGDLAKSKHEGADFEGAYITQTSFYSGEFNEAKFSGTRLKECNLNNAELNCAQFDENLKAYESSNFAYAKVHMTALEDSRLDMSKLDVYQDKSYEIKSDKIKETNADRLQNENLRRAERNVASMGMG